MSFKHVGALDVRTNFFVRPAAFDAVVQWVKAGLVVMVNPETFPPCHLVMCCRLPPHISCTCYPLFVTVSSILHFQVIGHRQAGKSTLAVMLAHHIVQQQPHVGSAVLESVEICLNRNTPMVCLWEYVALCVCVQLLVSVMCCKQFICSDMILWGCKLRDPAGFLHWFHTVLRIHRPDVICAPRPLSAGPESLANVQEDLLQALRLDTKKPRSLAIFVDGAGYMVNMHRMAVVTYLFGSLTMPRFDNTVIAHACLYRSHITHISCACNTCAI